MKRSLIISLAFVASILFSTTAAATLIINPEQVSLDIIGGTTNTYNITLKYTDKIPASIFLSTNIKPDGEGFTITFSKNPIFLQPNENITITMTIKTSINIIPKPYTIQIIGEYEHIINPPKAGPTSATGTRGEGQSEPTTPEPPQEEPSEPINETFCSLPKALPTSHFPLHIIAIISGVIFFLLIYIMRKKHKEVKDK